MFSLSTVFPASVLMTWTRQATWTGIILPCEKKPIFIPPPQKKLGVMLALIKEILVKILKSTCLV